MRALNAKIGSGNKEYEEIMDKHGVGLLNNTTQSLKNGEKTPFYALKCAPLTFCNAFFTKKIAFKRFNNAYKRVFFHLEQRNNSFVRIKTYDFNVFPSAFNRKITLQ